jgi:ParB family chromosome partitioning protein
VTSTPIDDVAASDGGDQVSTAEAAADASPACEPAMDPVVPGAGEWQLLWVDPRSLVIGVNIRTDAALDKAFVASIRDRGVREPVIVHRDGQDRYIVRKGQRRTLAAVQSGLELVPVVVEPDPLAAENARQVDRIVDQLGENQHRAGLPAGDEVAAHQQLLELGLTAGQIARRTRTKPVRVRTTLAVGGSQVAAAALGRYQLSLEQAAVIADLDGDQDAVTALIAAAKASPGQFEHVAQKARDQRAEAQLRQTLLDRLGAEGVRVIEAPDSRQNTVRALERLRPAPHSEPGTSLAEEEHRDCPGRVAWLQQSWYGEEPLSIRYGCENWALHGHAELYASPGQATITTGSASSGVSAGGKMSEEDKVARRVVIANNKDWDSATRVRRAWLRQFVARRTPPKDAPGWIAAMLAGGCHDLRRAMEDQHTLARGLLGLADRDEQRRGLRSEPHPIAEAARVASPARATVLALALLLAALEAGTSRNTWRDPTSDSIAYLTALAEWGYELAPVEQLALDTHADHNPFTRDASESDEPAGSEVAPSSEEHAA